MIQALKLRGRLTAELRKADGSLIILRSYNDLLSGSFDLVSSALGDPASAGAKLSYLAIGTGGGATTDTTTQLENEILRKPVTYSHIQGNDDFALAATFEPGEGTGALSEAGLVATATSGSFFNRVVFNTLNKEEADSVTLTITIEIVR